MEIRIFGFCLASICNQEASAFSELYELNFSTGSILDNR